MNIINDKLPDGSNLAGIELKGMVAGNARVSGGDTVLRGMVAGDLLVETDSTAFLYGMVTGNLIVRGLAVVEGMVNGRGLTEGAGQIDVHPGAVCLI